MAQYQGLTAEMYRAVVAIVDDRMKEIRVVRQEFDRLVEAHARTEAALNRLSEAQARTEAALNRLSEAQAQTEARVRELAEAQARIEEELWKYREASEARFARIEAALDRLAEAQAQTEAALKRLSEAQERYREASEARFARIEATLDQLVKAQAQTEARLRELAEAQAQTEARLRELAEAQAQTEARVRELAEAQARTEEEFRKYREASEARFARIEAVLEQVVVQLQKLTDRTGKLEGRLLELTYQQKAGSYFGHLLRRPRALLPAEIEDQLEGRITQEEFRELLAVDLLVSGRPRHLAEAPQVWLVVEISATVDRHDVERARQRADLLRRAGLRAIPTVAGEDATMGALEEAKTHKVLMLQDGRSWFWEEALAEVLQ
jgi:chromosome segregation ATPase